MKVWLRSTLLWTLLLSTPLLSRSLAERYPHFEYIFMEFDVDESFIDTPQFEAFAKKHEEGLQHFYHRSIQRGKPLLPMMQTTLVSAGLSDLLIYLAMVESGFSPAITSPKRAVGLWQFMPATARAYDLSVSTLRDERCDPISATHAAISYLSKLHTQFGSWYLAMMAYNCGEGRLQKAIAHAQSRELATLIDPTQSILPRETRDYIQKILLSAMIGEATLMDFGGVGEGLLQVEVPQETNLTTLALAIDLDPQQLRDLNRQFSHACLPTDQPFYTITIPQERLFAFYLRGLKQTEESNDTTPPPPKRTQSYLLSHTVALGESLEQIAKEYHTTTHAIKQSNHLQTEALTLGEILFIPVSHAQFEAHTP